MLDIRTIWEKTWEHLKEKLGKTSFETWILPLRPKLKDERNIILEAPDDFFKDWVTKHYKQEIQDAICDSSKQ